VLPVGLTISRKEKMTTSGFTSSDVCDRCYSDVSISVLPMVTARLQIYWQLRMLDSEFAAMRQQGMLNVHFVGYES
jgi:hypothetical protein